jgi:hypothetical protein
VHLALVDDALLGRMHEFDRILNGDDMLVSVLVDKVGHGASVVDLPLPVGPVTITRPLESMQNVRITSGRLRSSKVGITSGMTRSTVPNRACRNSR